MKVTVDTNVLLRSIVRDDPEQSKAAERLLSQATAVIVPLPALCELVWVLRKVYRFSQDQLVVVVQTLLDADKVVMNRTAAEAGLSVLKSRGDFADGVIAYEGRQMGGVTFASFDRQAVALLEDRGFITILPS